MKNNPLTLVALGGDGQGKTTILSEISKVYEVLYDQKIY